MTDNERDRKAPKKYITRHKNDGKKEENVQYNNSFI